MDTIERESPRRWMRQVRNLRGLARSDAYRDRWGRKFRFVIPGISLLTLYLAHQANGGFVGPLLALVAFLLMAAAYGSLCRLLPPPSEERLLEAHLLFGCGPGVDESTNRLLDLGQAVWVKGAFRRGVASPEDLTPTTWARLLTSDDAAMREAALTNLKVGPGVPGAAR